MIFGYLEIIIKKRFCKDSKKYFGGIIHKLVVVLSHFAQISNNFVDLHLDFGNNNIYTILWIRTWTGIWHLIKNIFNLDIFPYFAC